MGIRIDSNGKVFTDRVHKERVLCLIQTASGRIRGHVFRDPDHRIMDDLNNSDGFIAVGDAQLLSHSGEIIERADFLMVNKGQVVWMLPVESSGNSEMDPDL
jgi:hypothetical protein